MSGKPHPSSRKKLEPHTDLYSLYLNFCTERLSKICLRLVLFSTEANEDNDREKNELQCNWNEV